MRGQAIAEDYSKQEAVKVFVAGGNQLANEVICYFLAGKMGFACAKGAWDELSALVENGGGFSLDVVLLDFYTSGLISRDPVELKQLITQLAGVPVIIFNFSLDERIKKWVAAGVRGFLYNSDPSNNMLKAIKAVLEGKVWIPRQALALGVNELCQMRAPNQSRLYCLTKREKEILSNVAAGNTNSDIAEKLFISPHTVKVHIQNIFKKIGVPNRVKATIWAHHNNIDLSC
jgi:LuxR family transcriptional regulator of csgAB operon